jgi:hypothetical protein
MPDKPEKTWKTAGIKLGDTSINPEPTIDITENTQAIRLPDGYTGPFGLPVDAPLGVTMIKALWEQIKSTDNLDELKKMLQGSFAITLDKNVLLKTISQPRCEGVRFYLAMKTSEDKTNVLTLVTVGVDADGKDLLYDYRSGVPVTQIETMSLVAEYGHPPGIMQTSGTAIDPFVLFKYAQ